MTHMETMKESDVNDCLNSRVAFDRTSVDYKGMNLNNRNCPWFFSKAYGHLQPQSINNSCIDEDECFSIFKDNSIKGSAESEKPQAAYVVPKVATISPRSLK